MTPTDLSGRTIVITGASSGIGASAARTLSARGATVIAVGRDAERTTAVAADLGTEPLLADFGRLDDVRSLADALLARLDRIDVLVHNAGAVVHQQRRTVDGFELTIQANCLAPFLLQRLLTERLSDSRAHTVITSSAAHRLGRVDVDTVFEVAPRHRAMAVYGTSKLVDLMWARALARRTAGTGVTAVACHPGVVRSSFADGSPAVMRWFYRSRAGRLVTISNAEGAEPLVHRASMDRPETVNGQYFDRMTPNARISTQAADDQLGERLWERTEQVLGL
ncbi:SDR family NAD(P)-dependent oxidoreductase [Propionibacteriaceae bacterium Y1700]|uniref:SDR family NAD(P)-dependent oxidoreductase n=1 Tax=Microlunatus sp. Y1700 TaxID=3418487 RepID=UPI003DA6D36F